MTPKAVAVPKPKLPPAYTAGTFEPVPHDQPETQTSGEGW